MRKLFFFAICAFLFFASLYSVDGYTLGEYELPAQGVLGVETGIYSGDQVHCQQFNVSSSFSSCQVQLALKRAAGAVGNYYLRFYDDNADQPGSILGESVFNDPTNFSLTSSLIYYNLSMPDTEFTLNTKYWLCIKNTQATNYIHMYRNNSNPYTRGIWAHATTDGGAWTTNPTADWAFAIYNCDGTPTPSLEINSDLANETFYTGSSLIRYNFTATDTTNSSIDCHLYENGAIAQSHTHTNLSGQYSFNHSVTESGDYLLRINCLNNEVNATTLTYKHTYIVPSAGGTECDLTSVESMLDNIQEEDEMYSIILLELGWILLTIYLFQKGHKWAGLMMGITGWGLDFILISKMQEMYIVTSPGFLALGTVIFYYSLPVARGFILLFTGLVNKR